jgi:predicted ATPase
LAVTLAIVLRLLSLVGDDAVLDERAEQLVAVTTEQGLPQMRAIGAIHRGWAKVKNGDVAAGIPPAQWFDRLPCHRRCRVYALFYCLPGQRMCDRGGQVEESLMLLNEALQIVERTGERWFEAELNEHKGQLLLRQGHSEAAEELYCKALGSAQGQEAKLWELRVVASLARLRREQSRHAEARDLLAPVYGWFTEGFATPALRDAKAPLDALEGA